jgi:small subunit ribosomal protein S2
MSRSGAKTADAAEPLAEWERELLAGDAEKAAVEATGGDAKTDDTPAAESTGAASEAPAADAAAEAATDVKPLAATATEDKTEDKAAEKTEDKTEAKSDEKADAPYGADSAAALEDGSAPEGFEIKGNEGSKKFHAPTSPWYDRTNAEVWFRTPEAAEAAGFVNAEKKD